MKTAKDVLKSIKDNDVKYVDLRFTDPRGKWQHVTFDISMIDEEIFAEGTMFDGSSIAGWKAINESDMTLMPDPVTATIDPFFRVEQLRERFGSEAVIDQAAELLVTGIVHVDDRADEVGDLLGDVADVRSAGSRAEQLGVATGVHHVVVPGEGPVPRALREIAVVGLRVEGDRCFVAQALKPGFTICVRRDPEVGLAQLHLVDDGHHVLLRWDGPRR